MISASIGATSMLPRPTSEVAASAIAGPDSEHESFVEKGTSARPRTIPPCPGPPIARPLAAFVFDLGQVGAEPVARHLILAYDDLYSIEYFHQRLRPYWRRNGAQAADLLTAAEHDYDSLRTKSEQFDDQLMADLTRVGGEKYARLAALAYRQSLAAHKLVAAPDGQTPYYFPKENFSCGCISTVDVIYPAAPVLLLLNPHLVEASLAPVMDYVKSGKWPFPYAPHDLGIYPLANGRDPTKIETMPVEESGNMLILFAAIAKAEGNAAFAEKYAPILQQWADYLVDKGLDPENQLCTDDFAGTLGAQHESLHQSHSRLGLLRARSWRCRGRKNPPAIIGPRRKNSPRAGWRWRTTATTTGWPLTSPAPGARSTIWCGTRFWA